VFGSPSDGFARLLKDLKEARPTLIMVCYGANEAHAGATGEAAFEAEFNKLLDEIVKATDARLALVTPHRHEFVDPRLPDPSLYNNKLPAYVRVIKRAAEERNASLVDLMSLVPGISSQPDAPRLPADCLTSNGLHFTPHGYWRIAPKIAERMGVDLKTIDIVIDLESQTRQASGAKLSDVSLEKEAIRFTALPEQLPFVASPDPRLGAPPPIAFRVTIKGLDKSKTWQVTCDGKPVEVGGDAHFEHGAILVSDAITSQTDKLRRAINKKNEYWFHRHRPQNETYLFLFRKHEQGNNAVEIPQFDPLIKAEEKRIAELKKPQPHTFEIRAAP
jgi:hypothetical protein